MDIKKNIKLKKEITPQIYAYTLPNSNDHQGWVKIGYTTRDVKERIKEQTGTSRVKTKTLWSRVARFNDEEYFKDHEFHNYLAKHKIKRDGKYEWFYFGEGNERKSEKLFKDFTFRSYDEVQGIQENVYQLREEQELAVKTAYDFAISHPEGEFLWNAKPRFGKTLSAYDLVRKLDAEKVLIVTNRPAIANSWLEDFEKFIAWQTDYKFVSESASLKSERALTRKEFVHYSINNSKAKRIDFISLQDLKGGEIYGGDYEKLEWVNDINWDILIIDEAHEGVDTYKTDYAFSKINRNFTLHLSGTPFNALSSGKFSANQIFTWSYEDEQEAKLNWVEDSSNPYEELPKLNMYTYRMSNMITEEVEKGAIIDGEETEYAFDLNEFFSTTKGGKFIHEEDVIRWLDSLTTNNKYPFSSEELRNELKHTFWILDRVDSVKALARILRKHNTFKDYEIILAAGDGIVNEEDKMKVTEDSLNKVKHAIKNNDKTITLSVGQLTTGVTIPEWSAVLMLSNIQSPALYMQAAFRAQNPHQWNDVVNGKSVRLQKENAYVFDFAPERTLIIFEEFANNLNADTASGSVKTATREENIKRLLNFFPVIGEDEEGEMKELDFKDVLTIPRKIKATEVVRRGFMSNFLFTNISGIFSAPQSVLDVLSKLNPEAEGRLHQTDEKVDTKDVGLDDDGNVQIDNEKVDEQTKKLFGGKVFRYEDISLPDNSNEKDRDDLVEYMMKKSTDSKKLQADLQEIREKSKMRVKDINDIKKEIDKKMGISVWERVTEVKAEDTQLENDFKKEVSKAKTENETNEIFAKYHNERTEKYQKLEHDIREDLESAFKESTKEHVEKEEIEKVTEVKNTVEEDVRSRLRGFSRTIPSFIMAYGERDLKLKNFDNYIPKEVFKEVTGITIEQFKFLRDGGNYEEDGETKHFRGNLFDEVVFNESVQEFLKKKDELADYFENYEEDIFDYIPPQETNQIYTPKRVVKLMVNSIEQENPNIYDDSSRKFADLYMKSGLYITEIVKKLYNNEKIKSEIPGNKERIKHILENQVYGLAPSEIIYSIATNFIFADFDKEISRRNFKQVDVTPYAKDGELEELIDKEFKAAR